MGGVVSDYEEAVRNLAWLQDQGALTGVAEVIRERRRVIEVGGITVYRDSLERGDGSLAVDAVALLEEMLAAVADGTAGYPECEEALRQAGALCAAEMDRLCRMMTPDDDRRPQL
jgi:hypothetical protein